MKVLASDYDGTLRTGEMVDTKDVEAIHAFREQGNVFGLVTGRSMESIKKEIERNGFEFDFIIANNGGVVYDANFNKLQCLYMDFNKALDIISYIKTLDCVSFVINDGYNRYKVRVDENQIDHKYGDMAEVTNEEEVLDKGKIAQLVISLNDQQMAHEISEYINTEFKGYVVAYPNTHCVDIVPDGVSKAEGLYVIESYMDLDHDHIYTIGDSYNDIPMLKEFHGCAVAHAQSDILNAAEHVYDSVADAILDLK